METQYRKEEMNYIYLPEGTLLYNKYLVERELVTRSNLSIIYLAKNCKNDNQVVIKEFFPKDLVLRDLDRKTLVCKNNSHKKQFNLAKKSFLNKARIMKELQDDSIVKCYESFCENNTTYIVMKYYKGKNLQEYLNEHNGISNNDFFENIFFPLLNAVYNIHKKGYIHRDIKLDNIIICDDKPILIDFGSAIDYKDVNKKRVILTPGFSPIEFYSTKAKHGRYSDIYSLSAILYYFYTGVIPDEAVDRIIKDNLAPVSALNEEVSNYLNDLIMKNLALDFNRRDQSIYSFKVKLWIECLKNKVKKYFIKK